MKNSYFQKNVLLNLIVILALAGCAYVTAKDELTPFVGKPITFVIAQYGPPSSQQTADGQTYYSWDDIERSHPGSFPGFHSICKLTMMTDQNGIVTTYTIRKTGGAEMLDSCI